MAVADGAVTVLADASINVIAGGGCKVITVANVGGRAEEMAEEELEARGGVATGMLYDPGGAVCCYKETAVHVDDMDDGECCKVVAMNSW